MEINKNFLKYTLAKYKAGNPDINVDVNKLSEKVIIPDVEKDVNQISKYLSEKMNNNTDTVVLSGKISDISDVSVVTTPQLVSSNRIAFAKSFTPVTFSVSAGETVSAELKQQIKEAIYNYHHNNKTEVPTTPSNPAVVSPNQVTDTLPEEFENVDFSDSVSVKSAVTNLINARFHELNAGKGLLDTDANALKISNDSITKSDLIKLTQDDKWEDAHSDFFGALNIVFHVDYNESSGATSLNEKKTITIDEIAEFLQETAIYNNFGSSEIMEASEFQDAVEEYSAMLQTKYDAMTVQEKLAFALERTKEYFESLNMVEQLNAMNRLMTSTDDKYDHIAEVGQIAIADLNEGWTTSEDNLTLGAYQYYQYSYTYKNNATGKYEDVSLWTTDADIMNDPDYDDADLGIILDVRLLGITSDYGLKNDSKDKWSYMGNWYDLVNTLVHEITHATAYQYYETVKNTEGEVENYQVSANGIEQLHKLGLFANDNEYDYYLNLAEEYGITNSEIYTFQYYCNLALDCGIISDTTYKHYAQERNISKTLYNDMVNSLVYRGKLTKSEILPYDEVMELNDKYLRLLYLATVAWGEYSAYSTDANYMDSIAGDIYATNTTTAVPGVDEPDTIAQHIDDLYNTNEYTEPHPDYEPWIA